MTEYSKLAPANLATSLRTTVPMSLVRHYGLKAGDRLQWDMETRDGQIVVMIKPAKPVPA